MNLRRLEFFVTLAQVGNMARAAEILHVSSPALSKAMKVLEAEVEAKLWIRDGRAMVLTDKGKRLLRQAPRLIDEMAQLKDALSHDAEGPHTVRIGTFEVFSTYFLGALNRMKWNEHALELHELLPGEIERYVEAGQIDIGLTYLPVPQQGLDFVKVGTIEMGVFTRVAAFKNVKQEDLPFVIPVQPLQGVPTKVRGLDGWPDNAYRRKVLHRVTLLESAMELCRQGRVAGYFPVFIVNEHNRRVKPEFRLERRPSPYAGRVCRADVFLVKRKSSAESTEFRQLATVVRALA